MADNEGYRWYVMRDLKRRNSLTPAYRELRETGFEVFTPMHWIVREVRGRRVRIEEPVIADLLFVHSVKAELDRVVSGIRTLQYRYQSGKPMNTPTTVRDDDMDRFMSAVENTQDTRYYQPEEVRPEMYGREVRIIGGPLDGYTGRLLSLKGSRKRRLIVEIPSFITAAVEVDPDYIKFV